MRKFVKYEVSDTISFKESLLFFAKKFPRCCFLDNNSEFRIQNSEFSENKYSCIAGVDSVLEIISSENSFEKLKRFHKEKNDWLFGFFSYDLKNEVENLSSENFDGVEFPQMNFFQPKYVFIVRNNNIEIRFLSEVSTEEEVATIVQDINNQLQIVNCKLHIEETATRTGQSAICNLQFAIRNCSSST